MDILRKHKKLIIGIIILLSVLFINSFQNSVSAVSIGEDRKVKGVGGRSTEVNWDNYSLNDKLTLYGGFFYYNNFTFCSESNEEFEGGWYNNYTFSKIVEITAEDSKNSSILNGYAYILSQDPGRTGNAATDGFSYPTSGKGSFFDYDPLQVALWKYYRTYGQAGGVLSNTIGITNLITNNVKADSYSSTIFNTAKKIADGEINNGVYYTAKIYVITNDDFQNFIIVDKTSNKISFDLKKIDKNGIGLEGATIKLSPENDVKTINGSTESITLTSGSDGMFKDTDGNTQITVETENKSGIAKVRVEEVQSPKGYKVDTGSNMIILISYTDGNINGMSLNIGSASEDEDGNWTESIINNLAPIDIPLRKIDKKGNNIQGVVIKVSAISGIDNINWSDVNPGTAEEMIFTSDENGIFRDETGDELFLVPTEIAETMVIEIEEISTPYPYDKMAGKVKINISCDSGEITDMWVDSSTLTDHISIEDDLTNISLINTIKPIELVFVKTDENGQRLGAGYKFELTLPFIIGEGIRVTADRTYVQEDKYSGRLNDYILTGTEFYLKTDSNGEIHVTIHPEDLRTIIRLQEQDGNFIFDKVDGIVEINLEDDKIESSSDCITITGTAVEGSEVYIKENPMPLELDLNKIDSITGEGVDDAKFSVVLTKEGTSIYNKTNIKTKNGGKLLRELDVSEKQTGISGNNFVLELTETSPAPDYAKPVSPNNKRKIYFHYENNNGVGRYVIDREENGNGGKYTASEEKYQANFEGNTLNVFFPNDKLIQNLKIEKLFKNDIGTNITEYVKENLLTEDDTVQFELKFTGFTAKINDGTSAVTGGTVNLGTNNTEINLNEVKLKKGCLFGILRIKETKTVNGFKLMTGTRKIIIARDLRPDAENEWKLIKFDLWNDSRVGKNEEGTYVIELDNVRLDTIPLPIEKVGADGNKLGAGYKFTVTIPNSNKIKINKRYVQQDKYSDLPEGDNVELLPDGDKYYLVTASDSSINLEISPKSGVTTLNVTLEETETGNDLFKTVTGTLKIVRNADGTMSFTSSSTNVIEVVADNKIKVHEEHEDIVLDLTKVNDLGKEIEGATANVELMVTEADGERLREIYNNDGHKITFGHWSSEKIDITPYIREGLSEFALFVTEIEAPNGYKAEDAFVVFKYENNNGNAKYNITREVNSSAVFDESKSNQLNLNVNIENEIDDLDIKIEKLFLDTNGQDITEDVVNNELPKTVDGKAVTFDITFEGCSAIIDSEDELKRVASNNTQSVGLGTNDNFININNIKLNEGSTQGTIRVLETVTLPGFDLIEQEMLFYVTRDSNNNYVYKLQSAKEYDDVTVNDSTKTITITNRQEELAWYSLELLKTDPQGNPVGSGYSFNINVEEAKYLLVSGKYLKEEAKSIYTHVPYTNIYVVAGKEVELVTVDSKIALVVYPDTERDLTRESIIAITETYATNRIFGTIEANLKVKHNENNLMDVTITSNDTNIATVSTRTETEGTETIVVSTVEISEKVELLLEAIKKDFFGGILEGAKAKVSLKAYNETENREVYNNVIGDNESFGDFTSDIIDVTNYIKDGLTNFELVIKEIEAPEGFKVLQNPITVNFHYEYSEGTSKFIMDSENAKIDENVPNKVVVEVINEPKIDINLKKEFVNPKGEVISQELIEEYTRVAEGEEVVFDIALEGCKAKIAGDTELSSEKTVILNHENDFDVVINEIELSNKTKPGKIIVKETRTLNGFTYYSEEMEFYVRLDSSAEKGYTITEVKDYEYARIEDCTIIVTNKQDAKYPVTIKKIDTLGNSLGAGYKFTIKVEEAKYIEVDEKYIQNTEGLSRTTDGYRYIISGTEFNLQTDKEGEIRFIVYPDSSKDLTEVSNILLRETEAGSKVFELVETGAKVEHSAVNGIVTITKQDEADINLQVEGNNTLKIIEDFKDLELDLTKFVDGTAKPGAIFDITLSADGVEPIVINDVVTEAGKKLVDNINIKDFIGKEITLELLETRAPEGAEPVPEEGLLFTIKLEYKNEEGNARFVITEDRDNIVQGKAADGSIEGNVLDLLVNNNGKGPDLTLDLEKFVNNTLIGAEAEFDVKIEVKGTEIYYTQNNQTRSTDGRIVDTLQIKKLLLDKGLTLQDFLENDIILTLVETKAPKYAKPVPEDGITYVVKLQCRKDGENFKYIVIEDNSDIVKGKKADNSLEGTTINVLINNEFQPVGLTIQKAFVNAAGTDITEETRTNAGEVKFDIEFKDSTAIVDEMERSNEFKNVAVGTDCNINVKDIKLNTGKTSGTIVITEKETIDEFEKITDKMEFTLKLDLEGRLVVTPRDDYKFAKVDNDINTIKITNKKSYNLQLQKIDTAGATLGAGYEFGFQIDNARKIKVAEEYVQVEEYGALIPVDGYYIIDAIDGIGYYNLKTNSAGKIEIAEIYGDVPAIITVYEQDSGSNLMKKIVGDIVLTVTENADKNIVYSTTNTNSYVENNVIYIKNEPIIKIDLLKISEAGKFLKNAGFNIKITAPDGEIVLNRDGITDEDGKISIDENISLGKYIKGNETVFKVEVIETAVPQGYKVEKAYNTFNLKYKVENGIPSYTIENDQDKIATLEKTGRLEYIDEKPVYIEGEPVTYTENKNTIYITKKNIEIIPSLNIEKIFKDAAGKNVTNDVKSQADNVKFNITFENATARVDSSLRSATFTDVVLGEDCNIDVTDIMLNEGKTSGKMFITETATIDGFEKLIETVEFKLEINSDKELTITKIDNNNNNIQVNNKTITIVNVKSYPLTIVKVDPNGDVLGATGKEYEFNVEIDSARGIELPGKYVQGKSGNDLVQLTQMPYKLKTVNGRIEIAKVYADIPGTIRLTETKTGNKVTKAVTEEMIINTSSDSSANIVFSENNEKLKLNGNTASVENDIYVNTNIKKTDENGTIINGAIFTVNMKAGEEYVKDEDGVDIKDRKITIGTKLLSDINMSDYANKEITLTLHEDQVPEGYDEPSTRDYEVKFKYVNNGGVPEYEIISGTDIATYNKNSNTINVTIKNTTRTWNLVLEKLFRNINGEFVTENPDNVEFHIEFSDFTATIDDDEQYVSSADVKVGNDNIININNIKFANSSKKKGLITIKETVGQEGYRKLEDEFQYNISIDKNQSLVITDADYENAIVDTLNNKISIINSKVYPLKIEKYDRLGNKLKGGFEFTVKLADTDKIVINKNYVNTDKYTVDQLNEVSGVCTLEGNEFYLKTDSNGEILISEIHGAVSNTISIEETKSPNPLFGLVSGTVITKYADSGFELQSLSEPTIEVDNSRSIKVIKVYDDLKPVTMDLLKYAKDNKGNKVPLEGATFRISMTYQKDGTTYYVKDIFGNDIKDDTIERFTDKNGEFILENIDVTDLVDKEITAILTEYQEPENAEELEVKQFTVVFKYNYNSGNPRYNVISSEECDASFDGNTLKIEKENKKLPQLTIEKHFIDKYGDDVTESVRRNKLVTGNEVKFKITLNNCDALVEGTKVTSGNSKEVGLGEQDIFIFIKDVEIKSGNTATIKVKETATIDGFELNSNEMTFTVTLDEELNWDITENYSNVQFSSDRKILIVDNYEKDDKDNITLIVNKVGNSGEKISNVPFKVNVKSGSTYLKDTSGNEIKNITKETGSDGVFRIPEIDITGYKDKDITITIEETEAPSGYIEKTNKVTTIVCKYNSASDTLEINEGKSSNYKEAGCQAKVVEVTIENIKKLPDIKLIKVDNLNNIVNGAQFKIKLEGVTSLKANGTTKNSPSTEFNVTTDENGFINLTEIVPANISSVSDIKLIATEINAPSGLKLLSKPIEVTYKYNPSTGEITNLSDNYTTDDVTVTYKEAEEVMEVKAIDYFVVDLTLTKEDNSRHRLSNVEFTLDFGGAVDELTVPKECLKGGEEGNLGGSNTVKILKENLSTTTFVTNSSGQIVLTDIILNKEVATLKVTEKTTPSDSEGNTYKRIDKTMTYRITYDTSSHELTVSLTNGNTNVSISDTITKKIQDLTSATVSGNKINMKVINIPTITLSGKVWLDGQIGDKAAKQPDGFSDDDKGRIAEVNVYLYNKDIGEIIASTTTNNKGEYTFKGYEKAEYIILFEYNGIKYQGTEEAEGARQIRIDNGIDPETVDSDANEKDVKDEYGRNSFNSRFKTIAKDVAQDASGNVNANLTYTYDSKYNKSILNGEVDGCNGAHNEGTFDGNFKVRAATGVYSKTTKNIDLGLVERYFDLSLSNYATEVRYEINGVVNPIATKKTEKDNYYDASVYYSDYTYRFDDFYMETEDGKIRKDITDKSDELEIFVTYNLKITNNSGIDAENAIVKYTFDKTKYKFESIGEGAKIPVTDNDLDEVDDNDDGILEITVTKFNTEIPVVFKLRKQGEPTRSLPTEIKNAGGLTLTNSAEIISYSTKDGGYVDCDSAPANERPLEDDYAEFSVNFKITANPREISGNVAEAEKGILNGNNINDILVQLVEIVEKDGKYYEYIWQETRTGSRQVKALERKENEDDPTITYIYENNLPESGIDGRYQFLSYSSTAGAMSKEGNYLGTMSLETGYIPGNYIVRFIYGDGTTYDANGDGTSYDITAVNRKYNGQDYKSTVDTHYKDQWYNKVYNETTKELDTIRSDSEEGWKYAENASVARDNEARRLEVMAYSTQIDGPLGEALNIINKDSYSLLNNKEKELFNEYFETLVALEQSGDLGIIDLKYKLNMSTTENVLDGLNNDQKFEFMQKYVLYRTYMVADTSLINVKVESSEYKHVNFGLELRPQTKLVLEKHITGMTLSTNAGTPLVNASVTNEEDYLLNGAEATIQGEHAGLATIRSTRGNRGFWQIETDMDELAQGATVRVQYTYVIKNESDKDYLSKTLVEEYEKGNDNYVSKLGQYVNKVKDNVKTKGYNQNIGYYLGEYYYTGNVGSSVEVPTKVENFEEYLNEKIKVSDASEDSIINNEYFNTSDINKDKVVVYNDSGIAKTREITTTKIANKNATIPLTSGKSDITKKLWVSTVLSSAQQEVSYPSYITQITKFSNAAGRKCFYDKDTLNGTVTKAQTPGNLTYIHSDDNEMTLDAERVQVGTVISYVSTTAADILQQAETLVSRENINELDEFWGETITVRKPTGEDKSFPVQIVIITTSSILLLGAGIILIKKYALKK